MNPVSPVGSAFEILSTNRQSERRGIDFMNGDGPGVRLNIARAQEYARSQTALH